jgi:hypothetical protein
VSIFLGLPQTAVKIFTPSIVFGTTQGTVTYQQQYGAVRVLSGDKVIGANTPTGSFLCIVSVSLIFTFTGSAGVVTVAGFPFSLPASINGARQATLSMTAGIDPPTNSQGSPKSSFIYPSTNPASCALIYSSSQGADISITDNDIDGGGTTVGITQAISAIVEPQTLFQSSSDTVITTQSRKLSKFKNGKLRSITGRFEDLIKEGHIDINEILAFP